MTAKTALVVVSSATARPRVSRYKVSNVGVVTVDSNYEVTVGRFTVAGTTTGITPPPLDPNDPAATLFTAGSNAIAEPTYTASSTVDDIGVSPRSWYEFVATPGVDDIVLPAVAANGIGWLVATLGGATTVKVVAQVLQ